MTTPYTSPGLRVVPGPDRSALAGSSGPDPFFVVARSGTVVLSVDEATVPLYWGPSDPAAPIPGSTPDPVIPDGAIWLDSSGAGVVARKRTAGAWV